MSKIKTAFALLKKPGVLLYTLAGKEKLNWMSDKMYLSLVFRFIFGRKINWENPKTFNEKLQWMKINFRDPKLPPLVDKYEVKRIMADELGEEYIIPNLGVWERAEDIDFDTLPDRFVLKCTHDSGSVVICKDKSIFNVDKARESLNAHLQKSSYWLGREWPYRSVKPRIIAEPYLEDEEGCLKDYKFMCFNGQMKCCFVFSDRFEDSGVKLNVYDREWNLMDMGRKYTTAKQGLVRPENYDLMIKFAEQLSKDLPFVRVDFYEVQGKLYFGEMTFFPNSGFTAFHPDSWDEVMGEWLALPQ